MSKKDRHRAFFDVAIDGRLAGRIVMELYNDVAPRTCHNFLMLCTGVAGVGKTSGKPLHYKGSTFHRIIKNFMIQGGDFTKGDGTGGESVYGGMFDDEEFVMKHDEPFVLSMANKGPNTNGSQFFITTAPAPHLNNIHVVFGKVVSGQEVVTEVEHLKTNSNNRPLADVVILNCGELVRRKKRRRSHRSSQSSSSSADEKHRKKTKKKKEKGKKRKENDEVEHLEIGAAVPEAELQLSTVKPEDLPEEPEHQNVYLMRRSKTPDEDKGKKKKEKLQPVTRRISRRDFGQRGTRQRRTRTGHKIKGRGALRFRTPEGSSDYDGSRTPPHWRREQNRLMTLEEVHRLRQLKEAQEAEDAEKPKRESVERDKAETALSTARKHESGERRRLSQLERRDGRHGRRRDVERQSPERAVRHFTEDRSHRRVGEVDNNEESGRVRGREVTKEKRSGHGREKIHEVEAATNVVDKDVTVDEMRLEEEVVLDGAEELQESDDEAIRMELLRAREKAEEKAERETKAAASTADGERERKVERKEKQKESAVESKKEHHREREVEERGRKDDAEKSRIRETNADKRRHRQESDDKEHVRRRTERRHRSRSVEKSRKRSVSHEKLENSKGKESSSHKNYQGREERSSEARENPEETVESKKAKASVNGKLTEEVSLPSVEDTGKESILEDQSSAVIVPSSGSKGDETKPVDEFSEKSITEEKRKGEVKRNERSRSRKRSRSARRHRRSSSRRSRSRDRRLRSRSRSRGRARRFETYPRSRRPTRRELFDERMRRERERRRSLERRLDRRRSRSRIGRRTADGHSRRSRRRSSSSSSSSDSSSRSDSRSSSSSSASSKRSSSSSSNSTRSSRERSSD